MLYFKYNTCGLVVRPGFGRTRLPKDRSFDRAKSYHEPHDANELEQIFGMGLLFGRRKLYEKRIGIFQNVDVGQQVI